MNTVGELKDIYTICKFVGIGGSTIDRFLGAAEQAGYVLVRKEARAEALPTDVLELLKASKQPHTYCEDPWYSCPKHEDGCADDRRGPECDCGADEWNAKVDAVLAPYMNGER